MQAKTRAPFPHESVPSCKQLIVFYKDTFFPYLFADRMDRPEDEDEIGNQAMYKEATNMKVYKTLRWIYEKVISSILSENRATVDVYLRISTSMLNNLVRDNIITKEISMYYHYNLIRNTNDLRLEIMFEDLPF